MNRFAVKCKTCPTDGLLCYKSIFLKQMKLYVADEGYVCSFYDAVDESRRDTRKERKLFTLAFVYAVIPF